MTTLNTSKGLSEYIAAGGNPDSINNQKILRDLVEREVLCCMSSIVHHFSSDPDACCGDVEYEEILQLCQKDDFRTPGEWYINNDATRCDLISALQELNADLPNENGELDDEDSDEDLDEAGHMTDSELRTMLVAALDAEPDSDNAWREFCDNNRIDPETNEAYEHWAVTNWFATRLAEHGEIVGNFFDHKVWGRCCTGQAIYMDGVIAEIAADMQILDGQYHSWA